MTQHHEILLDVDQGIESNSDGISLVTGASSGTVGYSRERLRGGLSDGVEVITLIAGDCRLRVLPTRGMGIWDFEVNGLRVGWDSPVARPVHPQFVDQGRRNGIGWLDGFNELICRCGLEWNGAPGIDDCGTPLELHGRIANLSAHRLELTVESSGVRLTGWVDESSLFGPRLRLESTIRLAADAPRVSVIDRITNLGGQPAEVELLYHTNIGCPILEDGASVIAAPLVVSPRDDHAAQDIQRWGDCSGPQAGYAEQCYFLEMASGDDGKTAVMLQNAAADRGVALTYPVEELPCFTFWKNTQAESDGYVVGLEPGTDLPNHRSFERQQGRVRVLQPGDVSLTSFELSVLTSAAEVQDQASRIRGLLGEAQTTLQAACDERFTPPPS